MIKDYAYEKLSNKEEVHRKIGNYFEEKLKESKNLDWDLADSIILHYKKVGKRDYNELGMTYRNNHQDQRALLTFQKGLEKSPGNVVLLNELGITYRESGKYQLAIDTFLLAIQCHTDSPPSYNELGRSYRQMGQNQLAINTFKKAIRIKPDQIPSYNELGITYREIYQNQNAINIILKLLQLTQNNCPYIMNWVLPTGKQV
ncbi:MAG: tetratricopeptide repeat protein [Bacteroidales bacterium]|nr:tetratricopeptide repeat protein [Bacteroidales bacterium]